MNSSKRTPETIRDEIQTLVREYCAQVHAPAPFDPRVTAVPVAGRVFDSSDVGLLVDSALEFWLTTGRYNAAFEKQLGQRLGAKHVLTVNSGSSANLVALAALTSPLLGDRRIRPGAEVITPAASFPTTVNPILMSGMTPVFIDVELPTYNMTPETVEAAITPNTRAIMAAHTLGNPFDAERIAEIARRHDLWLVEDCCDALGATLNGRQVGSFGDVASLSFYPAHHITMGEGGAVFTSHAKLRRAAESIRDWGRDCFCEPGQDDACNRRFGWSLGELPGGYDHKYTYSHLGYNLKITDMQAAVGLAQLDHLEGFIAARRSNFAYLLSALAPLEEFFIFPEATRGSDPSWFGFALTLRAGAPFTRDDVVRMLNRHRIGTRLLFGGNLTRQPYMLGRDYRVSGALTNSDRIMRDTFWVGVYPGLDAAALDYMADTLHTWCRNPMVGEAA